MSTTYTQIIQAIIPIICLLITAGGAYLVALIRRETTKIEQQVDNEIATKYIEMMNDAVTSSVIYVTQTFVDALKRDGKFDKEKQIEAFNMAKDRVLDILGDTTIEILNEIYNDVDAYIEVAIEKNCWEVKQTIKSNE